MEAVKDLCSKISSAVDATNEKEKTGNNHAKKNEKNKNASMKATMRNKQVDSEEHTQSCPKEHKNGNCSEK